MMYNRTLIEQFGKLLYLYTFCIILFLALSSLAASDVVTALQESHKRHGTFLPIVQS